MEPQFVLKVGVREKKLRRYITAEKLTMQDWSVEIRKRMQGKHAGDIYCVFIDGKGNPYYTLIHACTIRGICWACLGKGIRLTSQTIPNMFIMIMNKQCL